MLGKKKLLLMNQKPQSDEQLLWYIEEFLGFHIATKAVCPHHRSPFEFISDMFFNKGEDNKVVLASRDSGKTQDIAIINALNIKFKPGIESAIVGAISDQAYKCYSYIQEFHNKNFLYNEVINSIMQVSRYKNGAKVEIVVGTATGVNSPHPNIVFFDETDLIKWNILQQGFSMPHASNIYKSQIILDSTRKDTEISTGSMQKLIDNVEDGLMPFTEIYSWCIWEVIEKCYLPNCSQCKKIMRYNEEGKPESFADKCQGKAKLADGHYQIQEVWKKFTTLDYNTFDSEWLCERPVKSGRMLPQFNENIHMIDCEYNPNLPVDSCQDFGFSNPIVTLFAQIDSSDTVYIFDELVEYERTAEELCAENGSWNLKNKEYKPRIWCCDPENPSDRKTMRTHGINEVPVKCGVYESTQLVRKWLRPVSSPKPKLYVSKKCKFLKNELLNWKRRKNSEEGEDKDNHSIGALRYLLWHYFGDNVSSMPEVMTKNPRQSQGLIKGYTEQSYTGIRQSIMKGYK